MKLGKLIFLTEDELSYFKIKLTIVSFIETYIIKKSTINYLSNANTPCGAWLACANIDCEACNKILFF